MDYFTSIIYIAIATSVLSLVFAFVKSSVITSYKVEDKKILEISNAIREGAMTFLSREYKILAIFTLITTVLLFFVFDGPLKLVAVSFLMGSFCSALAGFFGMNIATLANYRTAFAAKKSLNSALNISFSGGAVMGMSVVGLGLLGISILLLVYSYFLGNNLYVLSNQIIPALNGFALGSGTLALFARVGGGIFTKAADVGADLVGKVEKNIPEDDPRNPAVIADNVGDNVGDTAGMGADLFESYVASILSVMILGALININFVLLPLGIAIIGILASIIGTFFVKTKEQGNPQTALNIGTTITTLILAVSLYPLIQKMIPVSSYMFNNSSYDIDGIYYSVILGLFCGSGIGFATEYYTASDKKPVLDIVRSSSTGSATNILSGLGVGMKSTTIPILFICLAIGGSYHFANLYGIAIASLGMLSITGIQLAVDAYGPIADNAGGIAQMAGMGKDVREKTDKLDAVGNTTAAVGKGFAIGSATLTSLALFSSYSTTANIQVMSLTDPLIIIGLLLGAALPFLFSSMAITAVNRAAFAMIEEVRRQFRENPGILEGTEKPDYTKCIDISTQASLKEMIPPGVIALFFPVFIGMVFGKEMLGGLLAGVTVSGVLLAIFMSNAGGAWDNAKKAIEGGLQGGKGSDSHKAAVSGDTVGDPFKDTAGPSLNILIKLICLVAVAIAPIL